MVYTHVASPLGELLLVRAEPTAAFGAPGALTGLYLPAGKHSTALRGEWHRADLVFDDVRRQLAEYFAGDRREFTVALDPVGTEFQKTVWKALADIPYGVTTSYGRVAADIGSPSAARAVGLANGQNPISIIVPCHRVVGVSGALTGYGGGLDAKRWLLAHELAHAGLLA
jgi:methylated-DNA-[protein]-cysteine S-methyltransferase